MKTLVPNFIHRAAPRSKMACAALGMVLSLTATAQTYTTKADGNWNSAATWVGGTIPPATIAAGRTVNIKHDVTFNVVSDLTISGTLNIIGDTLRFTNTYAKNTVVQSGGFLNVLNGAFLQNIPSGASSMITTNGRLRFENAKVSISKSVIANPGTKRLYKNSTVLIGTSYDLDGSLTAPTTDTIQNSTIEVSVAASGDLNIKKNATLTVANARIVVNTGGLSNDGSIVVLPGAASNYGFNFLKTSQDLQNTSTWNARVDAYCVGGTIKGNAMADIDLTRPQDCSASGVTTGNGAAPELVFSNPAHVGGQDKKQGSVYRFSNITPGIDAELRLKKFSRPDIVVQSVDLASMGWDKALQPQFGLPGVVQPFQNWYIDFELSFYQAGTNKKQTMSKIDMTALDLDGDGNSVSEYAIFQNPSSIIYSTVSYLTSQSAGAVGQVFTCEVDAIASPIASCTACGGDGKAGIWNFDRCTACDGVGMIHATCKHPFGGVSGSSVNGPVENFLNIDTLSTQVMATYQYINTDKISFRYGAKSGSKASNGSGIRLNSTWFRQFSLAPPMTLPVKITSFTAGWNNEAAHIAWTTENEQNFSHFIVERSTDGKTFEAIATVFAAEMRAYSFKDTKTSSASGVLYYRLRSVDKTKESSLSQVRVIRFGKEQGAITLAVSPNPATSAVRVSLPGAWMNKAVTLEVYTPAGIRLQSTNISHASGAETVHIGKYSSGMYLIKASCEGQTAQQRIVKN